MEAVSRCVIDDGSVDIVVLGGRFLEWTIWLRWSNYGNDSRICVFLTEAVSKETLNKLIVYIFLIVQIDYSTGMYDIVLVLDIIAATLLVENHFSIALMLIKPLEVLMP